MIEDPSLIAYQHSGIPETANTGTRTFVKTDVGEDFAVGAGLLEGTDLFAVDVDAFLC